MLIFRGNNRSMKTMISRLCLTLFICAVCAHAGFAFPNDAAEREESAAGGLPQRLVLFYQNYISRHDGERCLFHPTCSEYYLEALETYGFYRATLMFIDRILYRENAHAVRYYPVMEKTGRLFDPVSREDPADSRESQR